MNDDEYRITQTHVAPVETPRDMLRPALWFALFFSAAANAVFSTAIGNPIVSSVCGAAALTCAITLIVHHYRNRA
ncbi:hypothetical protein [Actinoplanes sp. NPDC026619]|uniref:hypothetical protein n=1 Tax=Actinoplanes sp. NPDC026619 TaxID=3155798 RepID=UPI0033D93EDD